MATDTNSIDYDDVSYIISSETRVEVFLALEGGMSTPSKLAEKTGNDVAHTSRALGELYDRDIVELIVSEERKKGRLYELTDAGSTLTDAVREVEGE